MIQPNITSNYDDTYTVSATCQCGNVTEAIVPGPGLFRYNQGAFAQDAFPSLSGAEREALFISGTCASCWDAMFSDVDDYLNRG